MALLHVSLPPAQACGVRASYIFFSNISWTPWVLDLIINPYWLHPVSHVLSMQHDSEYMGFPSFLLSFLLSLFHYLLSSLPYSFSPFFSVFFKFDITVQKISEVVAITSTNVESRSVGNIEKWKNEYYTDFWDLNYYIKCVSLDKFWASISSKVKWGRERKTV